MAVQATGSTYASRNNLYFGLILVAAGLYFFHDGWLGWFTGYMEKELEKGGGSPTPNLWFNRLVPVPLFAFAIHSFIRFVQIPKLLLVADDEGLTVNRNQKIAYSEVTHIDKRRFDEKGVFTVGYTEGGQQREIRFSARKYDKLALLLDELVSRTGAKPESGLEQNDETPSEQ